MNSTTLIGVLLMSVGMVLMYIGLYGWTGAPSLTFESLQQPPQNQPVNAPGGNG